VYWRTVPHKTKINTMYESKYIVMQEITYLSFLTLSNLRNKKYRIFLKETEKYLKDSNSMLIIAETNEYDEICSDWEIIEKIEPVLKVKIKIKKSYQMKKRSQ
jgi:hypothetical protein